jgi:uncharacterized protein
MQDQFGVKKIHDSVHKTISLSKIEVDIINTKTFQRLRNVKQLSLIHYVFPGADYSRFSHSIGSCHLAGKLFDAIYKDPATRDNDLKQKIRLAGLLHDIGHYPFSHTMEDAIKDYISKSPNAMSGLVRKGEAATDAPFLVVNYLEHENIGSKILDKDPEIRAILDRDSINPTDISKLFIKKGESPIKNLISSDLDADRLDYLLRDAHCIGLPYGSTDLNYILHQMKFDTDESGNPRPCIDSRAIKTVDHFLLSRYFDYSQVVFHKTVAGMEEVLKRVLAHLMHENAIFYKESDIINLISSGNWCEYDDVKITSIIREKYKETTLPDDEKLFMRSLLERIPPKEIVKLEYIDGIDQKTIDCFNAKICDLKSLDQYISTMLGIPKKQIFVWNNGGLKLTKMGRMTEVSKVKEVNEDHVKQGVRIENRVMGGSQPIMERNDSLMNILSEKALYSMRLFVLDPTLTKEKTESVQKYVYKRLPYRDWK